MLTWTLLSVALAGDGPWTVDAGQRTLFLGADTYRYGRYVGGDVEASALEADVVASDVQAVWTRGLRDGVDLQVQIPLEQVRAEDPGSAGCQGRAADFCRPTRGVGDVAVEVKFRALDELYGAPLTLAVTASGRSGEAYAAARDRLTTLGDGQTDLGVGLETGRTDVLGHGWYRVSAGLRYWYRLPVRSAEVHDQVDWHVVGLLAPVGGVAFGPAVHGFSRLGGLDLAQVDLSAPDVWASLDAGQIQVGGKLCLFAQGDGPTLSFSVLQTVYARNNPADTQVISAGLGWNLGAREDR